MEQELRKTEFKSLNDQLQAGTIIRFHPEPELQAVGCTLPMTAIVTAVHDAEPDEHGPSIEIVAMFQLDEAFLALPDDLKAEILSSDGDYLSSIFVNADNCHLIEILAASVWDLLRNQLNV